MSSSEARLLAFEPLLAAPAVPRLRVEHAVPAAHAWRPAELQGAAEPARPEPAADPEAGRQALEHVEAAAYAAGREAGLREAAAEHAERLRGAVEVLERVTEEIRGAERNWVAAARENITALAAAIAMHVVGRELRGDAQALADLVRRALTEFPLDEPVRVRLHPHDLSAITVVGPGGGDALQIAPGRSLRWLADPALLPGGCLVEGRERIVDGRVDRALERIYRALCDG